MLESMTAVKVAPLKVAPLVALVVVVAPANLQ
jgi:hypothetical protein